MPIRPIILVLILGFTVTASSPAAVTFSVSIDDSDNTYRSYHEQISRILLAACNEWGSYMEGDASIEIEVKFQQQTSVLMFAGANTVTYMGRVDGCNIWDQGPTAEIRTGSDPNGSAADGTIWINPDYLNYFWFDPASTIAATSSSVPINKYDAYSIFLHEMGHILGFNGWLEQSSSSARSAPTVDEQGRPIPFLQYRLVADAPLETDELPAIPAEGRLVPAGSDMSTYDQLVTSHSDGTVTFDGTSSLQVRTGGVPLEPTSYVHLSLPHSTMYSYGEYGVRDKLSCLELAILKDLGISLTIPSDQCVPDLDTDEDGWGDCVDSTPGTPVVLDSDGDGTPDDSDACPEDPAKSSSAGSCGCGALETDSDGDGIADCVDPVDDRVQTTPTDPTDDANADSDDEQSSEQDTEQDDEQDDEQVLGFQPTVPTASGCGTGAMSMTLTGLLVLSLARRRFGQD